MFRVGLRQRSTRFSAVAAACLLVSGCAAFVSQPLVFGSYRSIKDDPEDAPAHALSPAQKPKAAPPKAAAAPKPAVPKTAAPAKQPKVTYRPASAPPVTACEGESACMAQLKALIDNPDRSWIGKPETPTDHATGTRLFAYRALHAKLSCEELTRAIDELTEAANTFSEPPGSISAQRASQVRALNAAVETELRAERTRRCSG
jgi:hypothetical protein